jgi:mono/diheme cytochrome c family protein
VTSRWKSPSLNASTLALFALFALLTALAACDQPPSASSLRAWTKEDHHPSDDDKLAAGAQAPGAARRDDDGGRTEDAQLVDLAWRQQCTSCHGPLGHGDGQMGAMLRAPDLTRADWQSRVADAEIATTIRNGRNKMPRFDLPEPVLKGLVARIRSLRAR